MFCVAKLALAGAASVALPRHLVEPAAVRIAEPVHLQETKRKKKPPTSRFAGPRIGAANGFGDPLHGLAKPRVHDS